MTVPGDATTGERRPLTYAEARESARRVADRNEQRRAALIVSQPEATEGDAREDAIAAVALWLAFRDGIPGTEEAYREPARRLLGIEES